MMTAPTASRQGGEPPDAADVGQLLPGREERDRDHQAEKDDDDDLR